MIFYVRELLPHEYRIIERENYMLKGLISNEQNHTNFQHVTLKLVKLILAPKKKKIKNKQ